MGKKIIHLIISWFLIYSLLITETVTFFFQAKRYQIFKTTKENIVKLMDDLEQNAETSFEREVIHEEEDSFQLTSSQLKALKDLHDGVSASNSFHY